MLPRVGIIYDPPSSSWRTSQQLLFEDQNELLANFAAYGMTVDGVFYPLQMWARITDESDGGSWPTPGAGNPGSRPNGKGGKILAEEVKKSLYPTPRATRRGGHDETDSLYYMAKQAKWPTPQARDWKDGLDPKPHGRHAESLPVVINQSDGGSLNPIWVEVLMGYKPGWTEV
jgi:hypothetical protein